MTEKSSTPHGIGMWRILERTSHIAGRSPMSGGRWSAGLEMKMKIGRNLRGTEIGNPLVETIGRDWK
jgi:hypothetical protein